jgi:RNA polymerase sigma-70 factor (ECF subfamily)
MLPGDADSGQPADDVLMRAYGRGDAAAFETLYARHKGATYRYFLRHAGGETAVADELHQDLWLRVIDARERYEARATFATWLYTLARHRLIDHWRAHRGVRFDSFEDDGVLDLVEARAAVARDGDDDPMRLSMNDERRRRLVAALARVPPLQRDAFLLHVEAGLPLEAIAGLASTTVETVKSRLRYAYRRLREALEEDR